MNNINDRVVPVKIFCLFLMWCSALMVLPETSVEAADRKSFRVKADWIVVIDPGHGGRDSGAKGVSGLAEKDVALTVARMLAERLDDRFQPFITRSDDYWMDNAARTSVANNKKADLFISIHAAGGFHHQAEGVVVYSYRDTQNAEAAAMNVFPTDSDDAHRILSWEMIQNAHIRSSDLAAKMLEERIEKEAPGIECRRRHAPLAVLSGADMPAVIVEIGCLPNPVEEKKLSDQNYLNWIARTLAAGIADFLSNRK